MKDISQVSTNKGLTENEKNDFAIYCAILKKKEPELCQIITAWSELSAEQKQTILDIINKRQ
jgi:succinate dehydrogenase flavin-adding protein (antitoxin of CptAB toxin-antitoxin module)